MPSEAAMDDGTVGAIAFLFLLLVGVVFVVAVLRIPPLLKLIIARLDLVLEQLEKLRIERRL
jgi:hypothetical protein